MNRWVPNIDDLHTITQPCMHLLLNITNHMLLYWKSLHKESNIKWSVSYFVNIYKQSISIAFSIGTQNYFLSSFLKLFLSNIHCKSYSSLIYIVSMISPKNLLKMARKWEKSTSIGRKRISFRSTNDYVKLGSCNTSSAVANKGHFVIYTTDHKRFMMPLSYLNNNIFRELFKKSEEEFGISSDGPITLPCDSVFMNYIVLLIQRGAAKDLEKALLNSIATKCCSSISSCHQGFAGQNLVLCGY